MIEVGHKANRLKEPHGEFPYRWNLYVRSALEHQHLDKLVSKVVFNLHETFKDPCRVCTSPPYCVREFGYGEFEFPIDIYFNGRHGENKYTIKYLLELPPLDADPTLVRLRREFITFLNPDPEFRRLLIEAGATKQAATGVSPPPVSSLLTSSSSNLVSSSSKLAGGSNSGAHNLHSNVIGILSKFTSQNLRISRNIGRNRTLSKTWLS